MNRFCIFLISISASSAALCQGQNEIKPWEVFSVHEGFHNISDQTIQSEIAFFNIAVDLQHKPDTFIRTKVNEIPLKACSDSTAKFSDGDIEVQIASKPFHPSDHDITYVDNTKRVGQIDHDQFWGTDQTMPTREIAFVKCRIAKEEITLPTRAITGLYQPNFCTKYKDHIQSSISHCKVFQSQDKTRIYIYMVNSDGGGGYEVTWVIENRHYLMRVVDLGF
jgi:hypothetical protein